MDKLQRDSDKCYDCQCDNPTMHNSREVKGAHWKGSKPPETERFPGYLCVPCWQKANPAMWPGVQGNPPRKQPVNPAVIVWALFALTVIAFFAMVLLSPSARNSGYKACVSKDGKNLVSCPKRVS